MAGNVAIKKHKGNKDNVANKVYTLEEYFELEEKALYKSEFINGKISPMAGGTINHNTLCGTIYALLFMLYFNSEEEISIHNSDQKIYIPDYNRSVYSDSCAIVGKTITYNKGDQAILNPTLIIEVASKSTEKYDRTGKFRLYQTLPSFKEYVLISQTTPVIEVFLKIDENKWQMTSYVGLDKTVAIESLGVTLKMADIYKKITDLKDPQSAIEFPEEA